MHCNVKPKQTLIPFMRTPKEQRHQSQAVTFFYFHDQYFLLIFTFHSYLSYTNVGLQNISSRSKTSASLLQIFLDFPFIMSALLTC